MTERAAPFGPGETGLLLRAGVSSGIATLVDGAFYQMVLAVTTEPSLGVPRPYVVAAAAGAFLGAITNFSLNRGWAFRSQKTPVLLQASRYAVGSLLTLLVLQAALWLLVERAHVPASVAWLPAKLLVWLAFSYPFQRIFVFTRKVEVAR